VSAIGILGGTFNPPHLAHVALAQHALRQLGSDRVLLIPAAVAPHKPAGQDPGPEHRMQMCRLAIGQSTGLSVCALELGRGGPSYTVDTLREIHARHPDAQLTFIMGADMARTLPAWREPHEILELAELALAERDGDDQKQLSETLSSLHPGVRVRFLDMPAMNLSSSTVREHAARGEPIEQFVGPAVAAYIIEHGLYREPAPVSR
jgi:nicotinate-nucleotide adenylyltransferase